jgi:hypothetical protein
MRRLITLCLLTLAISSCSTSRPADPGTAIDGTVAPASSTTAPGSGTTEPATVAAGTIVDGKYRVPVSGVATQESFCAAFVTVQEAVNPSDPTPKAASVELLADASAVANKELAAFAPAEIADHFAVWATAQAALYTIFEDNGWDVAYVTENMATLVTPYITPEINAARSVLFPYCAYDPNPGGAASGTGSTTAPAATTAPAVTTVPAS